MVVVRFYRSLHGRQSCHRRCLMDKSMNPAGKLISYIVAVALLAYAWFALVPASFLSTLSNPAHFATLGGLISVVVFTITSIWPPKDPKFARSLVAQVLASMPVFYLWAALRSGTQQDVLIEVAGLFIFVGLALYGYVKSPMILGLGIMAHGLFWDSWHHKHSVIFDSWYPPACLVFDIAAGIVVIARFAGERELLVQASASADPLSKPT
jgi:hypothetical protein